MRRNAGKVSLSFLLVLCGLLLGSKANAQAQSSIITFDAPGASHGTQPRGINSAGAITGWYTDANSRRHGFLRAPDGTFATFDVVSPSSPGIGTEPSSINSDGVVTGDAADGITPEVGFVRMPDGRLTTFAVPGPSGAFGTAGLSINNAGEIAGIYFDSSDVNHSFVRAANGTITAFDPPGTDPSGGSAADSINAKGMVVGSYRDANFAFHGYIRFPDGTFTTVDFPGVPGSIDVVDINSAGTSTGTFSNNPHGFVRSPDGTITTFDVQGAGTGGCGTAPSSLNDRGTITGSFLDSSNCAIHGFVRAPDGAITIFDAPGAGTQSNLGTNSQSINASGAITGWFSDASGALHGFLRPGPPAITSFTPNSGSDGATVTITGAHFTGATGVAFNRAAASFSMDSDTQITATVPGGATTGSLSVTTPSGTGWSFSGTPFTVDSAGMPTVSSFSPTSGSTGWTVTLTGTNFTGTTGVSFNGTPATTMWAISDTQFNAKVPSGATSGPITLTNSLGSAASAASFTVAPHISSFTPASGTMGTTVTITGTSFTGASAVTFFRVPASFTVVSDTQITATVPGGALSGWISVKTPNTTLWSSSNFTPTSTGTPTISSFSPASGAAGWTVTITGANFTGTTGVNINGTGATTFWATSDTQLSVKIPSGATSGPITVANTAGTTTGAANLTVN